MGRVIQPDTLHTRLRDLERRLRLLEATARTGSAPLSFAPSRRADWWSSSADAWERLAATALPRRAGMVRLRLHGIADGGTTGQVRVLLDGTVVDPPLDVNSAGAQSTYVAIPDATSTADVEIAIEAMRTGGTGAVRAAIVWARTALT
jgi:hypothetical protein